MERYRVTKFFYKDYLLYIKKKGKYHLYGDDLKIKDYFNLKKYHLNSLKLDNLEILEEKKFTDNRYKELYCKMIVIEAIKRYVSRSRVNWGSFMGSFWILDLNKKPPVGALLYVKN